MRRYSLYETKKRGFWKFVISTFVILLALLAVGGVLLVHSYHTNLQPVSANQKHVTVTVPTGASVNDIAVILKQNNVIRSTWAFQYYVRYQNQQGPLQAGTYVLQASQSVPEIVDALTLGKISTNLVTILPGQRIDQVRQTLIDNGYNKKDVDNALKPSAHKNNPLLKDLPMEATLEGYIYPESLQKDSSLTAQELVDKYLAEMQKHLTPDIQAGIKKQGLTVYQGIILASIIEQEVSSTQDRKTVAQVFLKRLKENMALQSDATAPYGAILAGAQPSLTYDSPYNTYKYPGLPPGPISNVSESSLEAVAHPSDTDWLYFVSGDDGKTYFSKTAEEHEALTAQHCKKLCASQ